MIVRTNTRITQNKVERTKNLNSFRNSMLNGDPIEKETENKMFKEYILTKNEALKDAIIRANSKFVYSVAKSMSSDPEEVLDLAMEGMLGLLYAFDKFDPESGNKFLTFANIYIYKYMIKYIHKTKMIKRSKDFILVTRISKIKNKFFVENGRYPTTDEIIKTLKDEYDITITSEDDIEDIVIERLNDSYEDDENGVSYIESNDFLKNENSSYNNDYIEKMENDDLNTRIQICLDSLSERNRDIIKKIYGIDRFAPVCPEDIAYEYGMTTARINQIKNECINKMRKTDCKLAV